MQYYKVNVIFRNNKEMNLFYRCETPSSDEANKLIDNLYDAMRYKAIIKDYFGTIVRSEDIICILPPDVINES